MHSTLIPSTILLLLGADTALAVGCATPTSGHCADGITQWYDPDDGMICDPQHTGTLTAATSASYLSCFSSLVASTAGLTTATTTLASGGGTHVTSTATTVGGAGGAGAGASATTKGSTALSSGDSGVTVVTKTNDAGGSATATLVTQTGGETNAATTTAIVSMETANGSGSGGSDASNGSPSATATPTNGAGVVGGSLLAAAMAVMGAIIMV